MDAKGWSVEGRRAVVTGASSGIGFEVAKGLAAQGAVVVLACRDAEKGRAAEAALQAAVPGARLERQALDLADLASVRAAAAALAGRGVDVLVNNAGAWSTARREAGGGVEATWQVNVLAPYLLARLLEEALAKAGGRLVTVASTAAGGLDLSDPEYKARPYNGVQAYSAAKQADRMLTWALHARWNGRASANAMSPGLVKTSLNRDATGAIGLAFKLLVPLFGLTPAKGADTAVWLAAEPGLQGRSGGFYEKRKEVACKFRDPAGIAGLVQILERQAGLS
jgi:NAD(P)-dependent dehydrogenase (short-subunit alcohol dehydrogenase family)